MNNLQTRRLSRADIARFIPDPRGVQAFEALQQDTTSQYDVLTTGQFLTLDAEPSLGGERIFTPAPGELVGSDGGANSPYTLGLADTITAGSFGDATHLVGFTVDSKGRITGANAYALNSDNVTEGATNLFFTTARVRASLTGSGGVSYNSATGAIALDTSSSRNVDHTAVSINAGTGMSGGGDISATRTLGLDTSNTRNVDHAGVSITAGTGLTGGGDLTASRTLALAPSGVTAGTYASPTSISVDAYGRVVAIS